MSTANLTNLVVATRSLRCEGIWFGYASIAVSTISGLIVLILILIKRRTILGIVGGLVYIWMVSVALFYWSFAVVGIVCDDYL